MSEEKIYVFIIIIAMLFSIGYLFFEVNKCYASSIVLEETNCTELITLLRSNEPITWKSNPAQSFSVCGTYSHRALINFYNLNCIILNNTGLSAI
jgi:hypothetical protein